MVVSGSATILNAEPRFSVDLWPGVGVVVEEGEGYALQTSQDAIVIAANARGSCPPNCAAPTHN